ncbi:hypothetical protein MANES_06G044802v8 [Manihot esculenta]|uniref:Uncharacterized protein n=1 Tax=Manihot esculenta TaxID=3983 RepID=A0ACB7HGW4_MANES|nr:hypothetical protein MANES_06G044802v8 [Manihot esculenta]
MYGGFVKNIRNKDINFLSQFELIGYGEDYGYSNICRIWFKIAGLTENESYKETVSDENVNNMIDYNKRQYHISIYYVGIVNQLVVDEGNVVLEEVIHENDIVNDDDYLLEDIIHDSDSVNESAQRG